MKWDHSQFSEKALKKIKKNYLGPKQKCLGNIKQIMLNVLKTKNCNTLVSTIDNVMGEFQQLPKLTIQFNFYKIKCFLALTS